MESSAKDSLIFLNHENVEEEIHDTSDWKYVHAHGLCRSTGLRDRSTGKSDTVFVSVASLT